ncbi:MAG TPA: response regulator [Candidatus Udaeobacter sp.]|nr:response regulator [Candidatus Udaeobacter sp.]
MARILIMDDEAPIRSLLRRALENAGHEVFEAGNGTEGMQCYLEHPADVVISDILMPEKEGLECILELKRLNPAVCIIAISGGSPRSNLDVLAIARHFGARKTFQKPFDLQKLIKAIDEELENRRAA